MSNRMEKVVRLFVTSGLLMALCTGQSLGDDVMKSCTVQTLSGSWKIAADPQNKGREQKWFDAERADAKEAPVPGIIQQVLPAYHGVAWYWHTFRLIRVPGGDRVFIRFGAVDYLADVWVNGQHAGSYEGGETPFEFDVTSALKPDGDNLLAVRVLNPTEKPIDGMVLSQTPHRNKVVPPRAGSSFNSGGIMYPVQLRYLPPVHVADLFVRPDLKTGRIAVSLTVRNSGNVPAGGQIALSVAQASGGDELQGLRQPTNFPPGSSTHELSLSIAQPRAWNLDDPYLYRITAAASAGNQRAHEYSVRCGFRDFRVVDGFFQLNGKRLFLKSTHTGNHVPIGQMVAVLPDHVRRDVINAKASGFNCVRYIAGVAWPEQLDFCDEIGMLVYEECYASWVLGNSPKMAERFDRSTSDMIRRDRNHPSVAIWGLLNETTDAAVIRQAVGFLPKLRALDPTRLVLLHSGRWDCDARIGSVSNPGGDRWEATWGREGTDKATLPAKVSEAYLEAFGDCHFYPKVPQDAAITRRVRSLGSDGKPVFLSEYGIGSLFDVIGEWR
ncbi:MAG: glycoside hydrolase family 2 protein, partial [Kiritimatiellia bacterium]